MKKEALFLDAAAAAIGQNLIGVPIAHSKAFKKSVVKSGLMGLMKKKSPRTVKSVASDMGFGIVAPEVNAAKNMAYMKGDSARKKLHNHIRKMPEYKEARRIQKSTGKPLEIPMSVKKEMAKSRMVAMGDTKGLKRTGSLRSEEIRNALRTRNSSGIGTISKKERREIQNLPTGKRMPSSTKAAIAANVALAPVPVVGGVTSLVNGIKLAAGTKAVNNTRIMKKINKKMVVNPAKSNFEDGKSGGVFKKGRNWAKAILTNPFTAEVDKSAYKAGKVERSNHEGIEIAKKYKNGLKDVSMIEAQKDLHKVKSMLKPKSTSTN